MDGKSSKDLSEKQFVKQSDSKQSINQKPVNDNDSMGRKWKIPAIERRYSAPSGVNLKHYEKPTQTEERKLGIQRKETLNEGSEGLLCETCNMSFPILADYNLHLRSISHKKLVAWKKVKATLSPFEKKHVPAQDGATATQPHSLCPICQKNFYEPQDYLRHLQRKSHKKRLSLQKIFNRINAQLTDSEDDDENGQLRSESAVEINSRRRCSSSSGSITIRSDDSFECVYCGKVFTESVPFALHLVSRSHEKAKRKNSLLAELTNLFAEEWEDDDSSLSEETEDHYNKVSSG